MRTRWGRRGAGPGVALLASASLGAALVGTAAAAAGPAGAGHAGDTALGAGEPGACEVVVLRTPPRADDGTVMDIERVEGLGTVYYGSFAVPDRDDPTAEPHRRAVVWFGLDARPVVVGPRGTPQDVAFELTPTGLINGQSVVDERTGRERGWVQDLRTGRLTWADGGPGRRDTAGIYFRRINRHGNAAGSLERSDGRSLAVTWRRADQDPRVLPRGREPYAEGWAVNDHRDVAGSYLVVVDQDVAYLQGLIWHRDGTRTRLAGLGFDTYPRLLTNDRQAAGVVWYGSYDDGHGEAAVWPRPRRVRALGLLPGGGFSGVYGQSQAGWAAGVADTYAPDDPLANDEGTLDHSFLWTGERGAVRVLPSPVGVEQGLTDWREWLGGAAHAVHTGLDQVGSSGHVGTAPGGGVGYGPTVWRNASRCGELVDTTHEAFWQVDDAARAGASTPPPPDWSAQRQRQRISGD